MFALTYIPTPETYDFSEERRQTLIKILESYASQTILIGLYRVYHITSDGVLAQAEGNRLQRYAFTFPNDFFEGLGEFYKTTDLRIGEEILDRKVMRMQEKLLDPDHSYAFDYLEDYIFANLIGMAQDLYEDSKEKGVPDPWDGAKEEKELLEILENTFHFEKPEAKSISRHLCHLRNMGPGEYMDMCFMDSDYQEIWSMGFVKGIRMILQAGEILGYEYDHAATIFEDIQLKAPLRLLGTREAYAVFREEQKKREAERIAKGIPWWANSYGFPPEDLKDEDDSDS